MSPTASIWAALIVAGATLWIRRYTWRCRYEAAATANVAAQFLCLVLIAPAMANVVGEPLHQLTGRWNVEDLLGHIAYLIGIAALTHTMFGRLLLTEPQRLHLVKTRLERPATIALPTLIGVFWLGAPDTHAADLFQVPANGWLAGYWVLLCAAIVWVEGHLLWVLLILRRDRRSTRVATIYIGAIIFDFAAIGSEMLALVIPSYPDVVTWALMCTAFICYAVGAAYSWHRKTSWFGMNAGLERTVRRERT